jgi:hypothetical protein
VRGSRFSVLGIGIVLQALYLSLTSAKSGTFTRFADQKIVAVSIRHANLAVTSMEKNKITGGCLFRVLAGE